METITEPETDQEPPVLVREESAREKRDRLLTGIDPKIIRNAWFALSHVFLDDGMVVADMGCGDGIMTYVMAVMRPKLRFIGVDQNRRGINKARERYQLDNLEYKVGDISEQVFDKESLDCILNSYALHAVYSGHRYSERIVQQTLENQLYALKKDGFMFVRDYARPPEQFVLIEMPDIDSTSDALADLSEADFLEWYSEHARPRHDAGTGGFFLEELPARVPKTRLYRLPYKWAYEFVLRKDRRSDSDAELSMEYTFFTAQEFRKNLRSMATRLRYSAPYWDDDVIETNFEGKFKLFSDDGTPLGSPPTCFIAVVQKMAERRSLHIEERRPSVTENHSLTISAMRDSKSGKIADIVTREERNFDVIPYRVDDDGALKVYLHDGVARPISNAVARAGKHIQDKHWSGDMVEAIALKEDVITDGDHETTQAIFDEKFTALLCRDHLGLTPKSGAQMEKGPGYFPAPDFINEYVHSFYLEVNHTAGQMVPKASVCGLGQFQAKGKIREFDAQQVLDAISLGVLPNARLELQLLALFKHKKIVSESWVNKKINIQAGKITGNADLAKIMLQLKASQTRFKDIKGSAGQLRAINSVFVEEGQARGAMSGLSAQENEFVIHDQETVNKAVVLPLTRNMQEEVHAGFLIDSLPVPEKLNGKTSTISCPSFELPQHITNNRLARKFIAEKFAVLPEMVIKMGEPYYCHVSVTPQRIYPFAVAVPPDFIEDPDILFLPAYQVALLNSRNMLNSSSHMLTLIGRSFKYMGGEVELDAHLESQMMLNMERAFDAPDWGFPLSYSRPSFLQEGGASREPAPVSYKDIAPAKKSPAATPFHQKNSYDAKNAPDMGGAFAKDMDQFFEELDQIATASAPRPEKW